MIGHDNSTPVIAAEPQKFDTSQLERIKMTATTLESERRPMFTGAAIGKLAALPPATDEDAGEVTLPQLGLTKADVERIKVLARHVDEARHAFTRAEEALAKATRQASGLPRLRAEAGEIAARAFTCNGAGVEMAQGITDRIALAANAESALPTLQRCRDQAWDACGTARAALHRECTGAIHAAMGRAARRYSMLTLEITRAVASLDACLHSLPARMQEPLAGAWDISFAPVLCAPSANDFGGCDKSATDLGYRSMLCHKDHPRQLTHATAARGWIASQLAEAVAPSGIPVTTLLA